MGPPFYKVIQVTRGSGGLTADSSPVLVFGSHAEDGTREVCKGARRVMGRRKAKTNEWTEDMSGLQGEDSFFISKFF